MPLRDRVRENFLRGYRRGLRISEFDLALDRLEMIPLLAKGLPVELRIELAERLRDTADHIENYGSGRIETHAGGDRNS